MREFDEYGLELCKYQAVLFSISREKAKCSSPVFLRRFMYSDAARRMDGTGFLFESVSPDSLISEVAEEYGESDYGKIKYNTEELYWMGYIYRYWCYMREISSKRLYKIIKPEELKKLYFPYHSLDPEQVVERIMEAKQLDEEASIQRGVELLRELRKRKNDGVL